MPVGLFDEKEAWVFDQQVFIDEKPSVFSFAKQNEKSDGGREYYAQYSAPSE